MKIRNTIVCLLMLIAVCGCKNNPCKVLKEAKWTCNLEVVEQVQPGTLLYVDNGRIVRLPEQPPAGLKEKVLPSSIANETGKSDWTFSLDAGIPLPKPAPEAKVKLARSGVKEYSMTFTDTTVHFLEANDSADPIAALAEAKRRAQQYLDLLAVDHPNVLNEMLRRSDNGKREVLLVMQTLNSKLDYSFSTSSTTAASLELPLEEISLSPSAKYADASKRTVKFAEPMPIAYRALRLAVSAPSAAQATPQVRIVGDAYYAP